MLCHVLILLHSERFFKTVMNLNLNFM